MGTRPEGPPLQQPGRSPQSIGRPRICHSPPLFHPATGSQRMDARRGCPPRPALHPKGGWGFGAKLSPDPQKDAIQECGWQSRQWAMGGSVWPKWKWKCKSSLARPTHPLPSWSLCTQPLGSLLLNNPDACFLECSQRFQCCWVACRLSP